MHISTILTSLILLLLPRYGNIAQAAASLSQNTAALPAAHQVVLPPADEAARRITVPKGFAIRIFAQNLSRPRLMTTGPDGSVYVAEIGSGQIARLPDRNHDGLADKVEIVASGLKNPNNLEFHNGYLFVAENDLTAGFGFIERFQDKNNDGIYETRQVITTNVTGKGGHNTLTLHFGPDGKMYVSVGSSCNVCKETDLRRAAILRFNADGTIPVDNPFAKSADVRRRPVWVWGLRNTIDFLWTPGGQMWANSMGSDGLGDNLPSEKVIIPIIPSHGRWFGWPYCYPAKVGLNQPVQTELRDTRIPMVPGYSCAQAEPTLFAAPAHSAPMGMVKGNRLAFPVGYQDDVFAAYHGSWNTSNATNFRDCKVERVIVHNGAVVGSSTFATGWRAPGKLCGDTATWGRPVGLAAGSDGALYISDDKGGRVFRVVYTGP